MSQNLKLEIYRKEIKKLRGMIVELQTEIIKLKSPSIKEGFEPINAWSF